MAVTAETLLVRLEASQAKFERQMRAAEQRANKTTKKIEGRFKKMNRTISKSFQFRGAGGLLAGGVAGLAIQRGTRAVLKYASAWQQAQNRLRAASEISGIQARNLEDLVDLANQSRSAIEPTIMLYTRLQRSLKTVTQSEREIAEVTDTMNKAFKAGGASATEQAAGILQLSQALSSGFLQGDELRSLREAAPLIAEAIARDFNTTIGGLKSLGAAGELTSKRIFEALQKSRGDIERAFAATSRTLPEAIDKIQNAFFRTVGGSEEMQRAFKELLDVMNEFAEYLSSAEFERWVDNFGRGIEVIAFKIRQVTDDWEQFINAVRKGGADVNRAAKGDFGRGFLEGGTTKRDTEVRIEQLRREIAEIDSRVARGGLGADLAKLLGDVNAVQRAERVAELRKLEALLKTGDGGTTTVILKSDAGPGARRPPPGSPLQRSGTRPIGHSSDFVESQMKNAVDGLLKLIMIAEGTVGKTRSRGFNTTLGFGKFTDGPIVLVNKTLREILAIQTKMLADPRNTFTDSRGKKGSSAIGAFQITRETLRSLIGQMNLSLDEMFTPELQIKLAQRLIDETGGNINKLRKIWEGLKFVSDDALISAIDNTETLGVEQAKQIQQQREIFEGQRQSNAELALEQSLIGASTFVREKAIQTQRLLNELKAAGIPITDELRAAVDQLATEHARLAQSAENAATSLQQQQEALEEMRALAADVLGGFLDDLREGESLTDALWNALKRVEDKLIDLAVNNFVDALFGGSGSTGGGLLGGLLGPIFGGGLFAQGGLVRGPGTGTSDSIAASGPNGPMRVSDGEFIVNARATRDHRQLLEAINSGSLPRFATGTAEAAGPGIAPVVNIKSVNAIDGPSFLNEALSTQEGEDLMLNHISARPQRYRAALGV